MAYDNQELLALVAEVAKRRLDTDELHIENLGGHASYRLYHRIRGAKRSLMVMEIVGDPFASEEATGAARPSELPFLAVQRYLASGGIPVPEVYVYLEEAQLLLLEDLGSETLEDAVLEASDSQRRELYLRAIKELVRFQQFVSRDESGLPHRRRFDHALLRWELDHFREWLLEAERGAELNVADARVVARAFDAIADELAALPPVVAHRDYQSRNLMLGREGADVHTLHLIDFQDALLAPPAYDLVALLRDSYVDLGLPLVDELIDAYLDGGGAEVVAMEPERFRRLFWLQTVQRKLKDAGRFVFIDRVKGNSSFLVHIPRSLRYVAEAFARLPELRELQDCLGRYVDELSR